MSVSVRDIATEVAKQVNAGVDSANKEGQGTGFYAQGIRSAGVIVTPKVK